LANPSRLISQYNVTPNKFNSGLPAIEREDWKRSRWGGVKPVFKGLAIDHKIFFDNDLNANSFNQYKGKSKLIFSIH